MNKEEINPTKKMEFIYTLSLAYEFCTQQESVTEGLSLMFSERLPVFDFGSRIMEQMLKVLALYLNQDENNSLYEWLLWYCYDNEFGSKELKVLVPTEQHEDEEIIVDSADKLWYIISKLYL